MGVDLQLGADEPGAFMWIVQNQASLAVHICRIIATAAQDDRVYDFKNHLEPGESWHFPDEDRPFLVYGVFNDGHNAIEANAINQAANIDTAAMVLGVGSLILGGIALLFPPTAPLAVALVITGTAAALTSTGMTVGSDVVSLRQGVDDTIVGAVLIKFPGLSGRHNIELVISGGYKLGRIGNDPRPIAYDVKPLTIEWTDSSTTPVQQGMVESDVWPPFSSTQATSNRPVPHIYPRMEPKSFSRVRLSEGWHDVNAMCTMETSIYMVQAGSLYRVSPNNGCAELLVGSDELAVNIVDHSGEIVGLARWSA